MALPRSPKPSGLPPQKANVGRIRRIIESKSDTATVGRREIPLPKADMMREMARSPEGRAALADFWKNSTREQKEQVFEILVKEYKDPTGKANLNIEGRGILEAFKGTPQSPERAATMADDAAEGTRSRKKVEPEYEEQTGLDPIDTSRYPRQPLPQGFDPRSKNLKDPTTGKQGNATSSLSEKPGLRTDEPNVDWVETEDGRRVPVVSVDGQLGDADYAAAQRALEGKNPGPMSDFKARGSLTSPVENYDKKFLQLIDGKKNSNILQPGIGESDLLMELYMMLRAGDGTFNLSPNATFSSPREMAEVLLRNATPDMLANRFNPASPRDIKQIGEGLKVDRELAELNGKPVGQTARTVSEAADAAGVPRGNVANQKYYAEQVIPALEELIRRRFGDQWGENYTDIGVPDDIRLAEPATKGQGLDASEGTTRDPNTIPAAADTAGRPESTWQGPLNKSPLTDKLVEIDAAERFSDRIYGRADPDPDNNADYLIGSGRGIEGRTVNPKTDLHRMMKEQLAEINTPLAESPKADLKGPAEWSPSDKLPDPNRTKELVQGKDASRRNFAAEQYNEFVRPQVETRRSAKEVMEDLRRAMDGGADDSSIATLKEELRQAIILDSLVSPFGVKGDAGSIGSPDGPAVSTRGRNGEAAEPDPSAELEKELADARIAAGIDPVPDAAKPAKTTPAGTAADADTIDPLDSAATELDGAETKPGAKAETKGSPEEQPGKTEVEAEANADAQEAPRDLESERPNEESKTIPEDAGSPATPKDKTDKAPEGSSKRTWTEYGKQNWPYIAGAAALGAGVMGLRSQMFSDRPLPPAWGDEGDGPEGVNPDEIDGIDGTPVSVAAGGQGLSPVDRIRLMQRLSSVKPNLKTQTAQNWSR
jgi:hypothetical protein